MIYRVYTTRYVIEGFRLTLCKNAKAQSLADAAGWDGGKHATSKLTLRVRIKSTVSQGRARAQSQVAATEKLHHAIIVALVPNGEFTMKMMVKGFLAK